ncbi:MAG: TlpA family protein disulfide reductase [Bacteroidaceae bacterium]|nr:TlpA family protein disulfide reductase [Bacteroidaceae bacterium]
MKRISYILLALLAVACSGASKQTSETQETQQEVVEKKDSVVVYEHDYLVKVGDVAPDFTLNYTDGKEFTLSQMRGKVVMLQFTASWCGICRNEMPHIESDIWQRHKDNSDFVLVGVDREETKDIVEAYTKKLGTTYPMLLDDKGDVFASYAVRKSGITRNVLIDRDGRIVMLTRRYVEPEFKQLVSTIDSLLAK